MEVAYRTNDPFHLPDLDRQRLFDRYAIYQNVTKDFPTSLGKEVSKKERVEDVFTSTLTYGELEFVSIGEVFETIKARYGAIRSGGVFYDLGSGTGKGVITGAMLHDFDKCIGIEILDGLYNVSLQLKSVYDESFPNQMQARPDLWTKVPEVEFVKDDMFNRGINDADFIFANSTCFDFNMMDKIADFDVKPGTWAITLTKSLPSPKWIILESIKKLMSWGEATVYIQQRQEASLVID